MFLFVAAWLVAGGVNTAVGHALDGRRSLPEQSWYLGVAVISAFVLVCGIVFLTGRGWPRAFIAMLFVADAVLPWLVRDPRYPDAIEITPVAGFVVPALGVAVAVAMFAVPSVQIWLRDMARYREEMTIGPDPLRRP